MLTKQLMWVRRGLNRLGFDVVRHKQRHRRTFRGLLEHIRQRGLKPSTVIDVGVGRGTPDLYEVFAESQFILIEPLEEFDSDLQRIREFYNAHVVKAAASHTQGELELNVHGKIEGSSLYRETEGDHVDGMSRTVRSVNLDGIVAERQLEGPILLKIDVQGAELDVLRGAAETLKETEYVLLEASLFRFFRGGPVALEVLNFMDERGFALYDVHVAYHRPLDNALAQVDLAFVKKEGGFRQSHFYASPEQRREMESH